MYDVRAGGSDLNERAPAPRAGLRGSVFFAWLSGALLAGAVTGFAPAAHAQDKPADKPQGAAVGAEGSDIDRARALAKEAKHLLQKAQDYAEALDYATRAEQLYHAPIHLAIIGEALMGMGRVAEAMAVFERLASEPLPPTASDAFRSAQEDGRKRLKELSARVPSLLVNVKGPAPEDAKATVDGKPLALGSGTAKWFDPGAHKIHVTAPGYAAFDQTVTLPARGGVIIVDALLEVARAGSGGEKRAAGGDVPVSAPSRAPWIAAFAVGGAALVAGGVTGGLFVSRLNTLKARCPDNHCAASDQSEADSIGTLGNVSTAMLVVGAAGVATGGVILIVQHAGGSSRKADASTARSFELGLSPFGLSARGQF